MESKKFIQAAFALAAVMVSSASAYAEYYYGYDYVDISQSLASGESVNGVIDLNAAASNAYGSSIDLASGNFVVDYVDVWFTYSRAPIEAEHDFELDPNSSYQYLEDAGPTNMNVNGENYFYQVTYSSYNNYYSTAPDNQTVTTTLSGSVMDSDFIDYLSYDETIEYSVPANTVGLIEINNAYNYYYGPSEYGYSGYFLYSDGIPGFDYIAPDTTELDFTFLSNNGDVLLSSYNISIGFNSLSEVPVPAAAYLFASAILGLGIVKRRNK